MRDLRARGRAQIEFEGEGRTHQSFLDEADINTVMGKWRTHGFRPDVNLKTPVYGDFSNGEDYLAAVQGVKNAEAVFMELPAKLRAECNHDPGKLIEFVDNPENLEKLREYGVLEDSTEWKPPVHPSQRAEGGEVANTPTEGEEPQGGE